MGGRHYSYICDPTIKLSALLLHFYNIFIEIINLLTSLGLQIISEKDIFHLKFIKCLILDSSGQLYVQTIQVCVLCAKNSANTYRLI